MRTARNAGNDSHFSRSRPLLISETTALHAPRKEVSTLSTAFHIIWTWSEERDTSVKIEFDIRTPNECLLIAMDHGAILELAASFDNKQKSNSKGN